MIITIDGPTASGKSSVAKALAKQLGMHCLNTGLLYRAVAYLLGQHGDGSYPSTGSGRAAISSGRAAISSGQELGEKTTHPALVVSLSNHASAVSGNDLRMINDLRYEYQDDKSHIFYKDQDITDHLFDDAISQRASIVSACREIREKLLSLQRDVAKKYDVVADGRDCGTVVFPDADFKFYLTARTQVRAQRRLHDLAKLGSPIDLPAMIKSLEERDQRDMNREVAPLVIPPDAIVIDSSDLTLQETVEVFLKEIR